MKELSIEEKAKAYDEALEKAKEFKNNPFAGYDGTDLISALFPELEESEDERIRKALLGYIKGVSEREVCKETLNEWIAWLEKQDKIDKASYEIAEKEKREFVGDGFIKCYANFQDFKKGETYWLEYVDNDSYNVRSDNLLGKMYHITPCQLYTIFKKQTWLEKQGEQKPVDKVEPKFHEGDWVVSPNGVYWHIDKISNNRYEVTSNTGKGSGSWNLDTNIYHKFTIQDAKDGDVLVNWNNTAFIFKTIEDETVKFYIAYNEKWDTIKTPSTKLSHLGLPEPQFEFHPATKEQLDTLMKAMADAGYTFDFEKKELKKIEQKPAWSKEDEYYYGVIQYILNNECVGKTDKENAIKWLKSLNPQPKQKWSEEDKNILNQIINSGEHHCYLNLKEIDWLKSLRPQNKWKPSDEQMLAINTAINVLGKGTLNGKQLIKLREELQNLRERLL